MLKSEFLGKQKDLVQENNVLKELLKVVEKCLPVSSNFNIDDEKSINDLYEKMRDFASAHQVNDCYCFGEEETKKFINDYFNIKNSSFESVEHNYVNLTDFI